MADFANPLGDDDILSSSLSTAFSPTSVPRQSTAQPPKPKAAESTPTDSALSSETTSTESSLSSDDWKAEYEVQVNTWRAQSAEAREKAQKERDRWEAIREAEKREAEQKKAESKSLHSESGDSGWETVSQGPSSIAASSGRIPSPSPVDARDLVAGEIPRSGPSNAKSSERPTSKHERLDTNEKWEDFPSLASSFPSTSFPERSSGTSPELSTRRHPTAQEPPPHTPANKPPISATLAVFDSSLPAKARISALFASLAINMVLPFVNGVMLGFGELFAKNVVLGWFGWKVGGGVATNVGVGVPRPAERRRGQNY